MANPVSILGINCAYHESSACLIQDGRLVAVAEEERGSYWVLRTCYRLQQSVQERSDLVK